MDNRGSTSIAAPDQQCLTQKGADFELFKMAFKLIQSKAHLTAEGLAKIVSIKTLMNKGLSDELKAAFPGILTVERPSESVVGGSALETPKDPNWLAGFTSGEGCFYVKISKSKTKLGEAVQLIFQITQHTRDELLLFNFKNYLGCGKYYAITGKDFGDFRVSRISDITEKVY